MMQNVYKMLLSLTAASAVVSAEYGMRRTPDVTGGDMPCFQETENGNEAAAGFLTMLNIPSSEILQSFHSLQAANAARFNEANDAVRIVVIEQEKEDPAVERKTACLKAVEIIHEQEELHKQTETLLKYIRSAFDRVSLQVWGGASCDDFGRPELVDQCNVVVKAEDVVQRLLQEGKTDDQVCDIMSDVSNMDTTDNLSCQLCQRFVRIIDQALSQDVQQAEQVRGTIKDLCSDSMCLTLFKNYDAIVDWLKQGTESLAVCSRIAICSGDSVVR